MKLQYLLALALLAMACKKKQERIVSLTCNMPAIMLYNQQYSPAEWDTIITKVYNKGFLPPVITDTFVASTNTQQLQINHDTNNPKDYIIYLPSVNKSYQLYDITVNMNTQDAVEGSIPGCYHDIDLTLDSQRITAADFSKGKAYIELKK